jgi:hypothetical protein
MASISLSSCPNAFLHLIECRQIAEKQRRESASELQSFLVSAAIRKRRLSAICRYKAV